WRMPTRSHTSSSRATTRSDCTAASATSRRVLAWRDVTRRSLPSAIESSTQLGSAAPRCENRHGDTPRSFGLGSTQTPLHAEPRHSEAGASRSGLAVRRASTSPPHLTRKARPGFLPRPAPRRRWHEESMPEIAASRFVRYANESELSDLVCPPYDVIDEAGRAALEAKNPHN